MEVKSDLLERKRLRYADYVKALTIFLVILGHTNDPYIPGKSWLYLDFCYAFHMPLFFMLSGFFLHSKDYGRQVTFWECFRKDFVSLVLPFFLWGCIYMQFSYEKLLRLAYGSWLNLRSVGTLTSLWFLPVLFLAKTYCNGIFLTGRKLKLSAERIGWISLPILFAISLVLPHNNGLNGHYVGNFWGYDVAFFAAGFVMAGALLRPCFDRMARAGIWWAIAVFVIFSVVFYFGFTLERPLLKAGVDNTMVMCNAEYGPIGFCLLNAFSGSFALIAFSVILAKIIPENSTLLFVGANTMGIFLTHKHIIYLLKDVGKFYGFSPQNLFSALCFAFPALLLSLGLVFVILRFLPRMFGKDIAPEQRRTIREMFEVAFATNDSVQLGNRK